MASISACLIVKNECENLDICLRSLTGFVDEIVVVDTGSSDNTIEIAKKYTNKIFNFEWVDDFSAARNYSISKASSEFILIIDADEKLENGEILKEFLSNQDSSFGAWLVNLYSYTHKNDTEFKYTTQLLRLFKNDNDFKFEGIIHEQILYSILQKGVRVGNSDIYITHRGYDLDESKMKTKQERNLKLLEKHIALIPNDGYNLFNLAKTYLAMKNNEKAKEYFELALENCPSDGVVYPSCLNYYSVLLYQLKDFEKAISLLNKSVEINPNQAFAYYILGDICFELKKHYESKQFYTLLLYNIQHPNNLSKVIGDYHLPLQQVYYRLGRADLNLKDMSSALENFESGYKIENNDKNCLFGLIDVFHKLNDFDNKLKYLELAIEKYPNDEILKQSLEFHKSNSKSKIVSSVSALKSKLSKNVKKDEVEKQIIDKPLITLSMIVKNEEDMLEDCLKSVEGIVDEIVIVDTGSVDKTKEIAFKYGAKVYDFAWVDDFAIARNEALKYSTGQWILYLDADERIYRDNLDVVKLKNDLIIADENLGGIILTIESDHRTSSGSIEHHRGGYPRLFRNLGYPKVYFKGRVHEQITPSLMENGLGMVKSDIKIIHKGYDIPEELMQKKLKRNYTLLLRHVQEEPLNGYAWYQLGQTLGRLQLMKESQDAIEMSIKCGNLSDSVYASASSTLSQYSGNQRKYKDALYWAEESLSKAPKQIYGLNLKGYALLELNRKSEAKEVFELAHKLWLSNDNSVPQSGFDIMIDEKVILNGLERAQS